MKSNVAVRFSKIWMAKEPILVLQANILGPLRKTCSKKKMFFILDARQSNYGIKILDKKPENLTAQAALVNVLRKYTPSFTINSIDENSENGDQIITIFQQREASWYLVLKKSRPPEIIFTDGSKISYVRHGVKGTFTKKKELELTLPSEGDFEDILPKLVNDFIAKFPIEIDKSEEEIEADNEDDDQLIDSPISKEQKDIISRLKRKLKSSKKALEKQSLNLPEEREVKDCNEKAKLLQSYGYLFKFGDFELKLGPEYTELEKEIVIELNPDKNLGGNLDEYFHKAKKIQKSLTMGREQLSKLEKTILDLVGDIEKLREEHLNTIALDDLRRKHKLPLINTVKNSATPINLPYKTYRASTGHVILVGKGPKENDELTKSAKSNDYWLHAAGVSGSHVVIPVKTDIKDSMPSELIKEAAILAIHFSKYKADHSGETYMAKKSQIKKRKGMPAGLWNVERCETIFIRYSAEELQKILSSIEI